MFYATDTVIVKRKVYSRSPPPLPFQEKPHPLRKKISCKGVNIMAAVLKPG